MADKPLEQLIFLDEAGANLAMHREYGRILRGERLVCAAPYARSSNYSIISAIGIGEVTSALYLEGSVNGEIFLHYIENYLSPKLTPGQWVILDNVAFHKVKGVRELIQQTGANVCYLPPYSPDLSPIEHMWSKLKSYLRKFAARCEKTFSKAMQAAFSAVQPSDLAGWFYNCGYKGSIFI